MKNKLVIKNALVYAFYPVYMIIYFVLMFGISITNYIGVPIVVFISIYSLLIFVKLLANPNKNIGQSIMVIWTLYCVASIIMYMFNGLPLSCYLSSLQIFLFPMMFFYVGNAITDVSDRFYNTFLMSNAFFFLVGLYLYIAMPPFYASFLVQVTNEAWYMSDIGLDETNIMSFARFSSFVSSSYVTSALSVTTMVIALSYLFRKKNISNIWLYALAILSLICAILCQQRIAMASSALLLGFFALFGVKNSNKTILCISIVVSLAFILLMGYSFVDERFYVMTEAVISRLKVMNFFEAMAERSNQYVTAYDEILSYFITGKGLGAGGHFAVRAGSIGVCDGEYLHLLLEFGLLGLLMFVAMILVTIIRMCKYFNAFLIESTVIIYFLLCCIGENTLSQSYLIGPIFWYCLGRVWNIGYLKHRIYQTRCGKKRVKTVFVKKMNEIDFVWKQLHVAK